MDEFSPVSEPSLEAIKLIPHRIALTYGVLPLTFKNGVLELAIGHDPNAEVTDLILTDLSTFIGAKIAFVEFWPAEKMRIEILRNYGSEMDMIEDVSAQNFREEEIEDSRKSYKERMMELLRCLKKKWFG